MLDELPCVWNALFSESADYSFGYNEKLLNTSISHQFSNLPTNRDVLTKESRDRLFSLKRALRLILESNDPEITNEALEALFKLREELVGTFNEVSKEQGLEQLLTDSVKLIIIDAFNRKAKERNQEFSPTVQDVSNVKKLENFLRVTSEIKCLIREIDTVNKEISRTTSKIVEVQALKRKIEMNLKKFEELDRSSNSHT